MFWRDFSGFESFPFHIISTEHIGAQQNLKVLVNMELKLISN